MKNKFNYKQFKIGDFVEVKRLVQRAGKNNETEAVKLWNMPDGEKLMRGEKKKTRTGVITGVKQMKLGDSYYEQDVGMVFEETGSITVWRVRFGLAGREWCALPEDLTVCEPPAKFPVTPFVWTQKEKDAQREIMKDEPRDKKGRFI